MKKIISLFTVFFVVVAYTGMAQPKRATGANFSAANIAKTPQKVKLSTRSFRGMPSSYSLEQFCPTVGDQGNHGTCVAFANGYGVATILYAKTHGLTDKSLIDKYAFSASYLYEQIKDPADIDCQNGSDPIDALITMIKGGDALLSTVPYQCGVTATENAKTEASNYKIQDAAILFAAKGFLTDDKYVKEPQEMIDVTKKALLEGTPISTGWYLPESFFHITTDTWYTKPDDSLSDWKHSGHAMAIIGYDDNKAGGSFRVMNSWGTSWGDNGMIWIRYNDFTTWCVEALQAFADPYTPEPAEKHHVDPKPDPKPDPAPEPDPAPKPNPAPENKTMRLSGSLEFKLNTGEDMPVNKISSRNLVVEEDAPNSKEDLVAYTMMDSYTSGTKFRFYMNIDQEAYIYAFATDLTGKINRILPFDDLTSTHVGSNTVVAFPSDSKVIKLDENKGTDYLLILYSKEPLNMNEMMEAMDNTRGGLSAKIVAALGDKLISKDKIKYDPKQAGFQVNVKMASRNLTVDEDDETKELATGTVVPLMIEIKHN